MDCASYYGFLRLEEGVWDLAFAPGARERGLRVEKHERLFTGMGSPLAVVHSGAEFRIFEVTQAGDFLERERVRLPGAAEACVVGVSGKQVYYTRADRRQLFVYSSSERGKKDVQLAEDGAVSATECFAVTANDDFFYVLQECFPSRLRWHVYLFGWKSAALPETKSGYLWDWMMTDGVHWVFGDDTETRDLQGDLAVGPLDIHSAVFPYVIANLDGARVLLRYASPAGFVEELKAGRITKSERLWRDERGRVYLCDVERWGHRELL